MFLQALLGVTLLLDWWPNPNHVPLYVGLEKGFFEDLQILKSMDAPAALPHLKTGRADIVTYYLPQLYLSGYQDVKIVGVLIKEPLQGFLKRKGQEPKSVGTFSDRLVHAYVKAYQKPLHIKKLLDPVTAFVMGKVDMVFGVYDTIESEQLRDRGIETEFIPVQALGVPTYYELIFLSKKEQPTFGKNLQRSIDYSISHPDEAFAIYIKHNPDKSEKTLRWEKRAWMRTVPLLAKDQTLDPKVLQECESWVRRALR